jgi:hypothetical protein
VRECGGYRRAPRSDISCTRAWQRVQLTKAPGASGCLYRGRETAVPHAAQFRGPGQPADFRDDLPSVVDGLVISVRPVCDLRRRERQSQPGGPTVGAALLGYRAPQVGSAGPVELAARRESGPALGEGP